MSVVVRMEMPECCWDCPCVNGEYGYFQADEDTRQIGDPNERPSWCPIICQLPEGHGDLIDKESFIKRLYMYCGFVKQILPSEVFEFYLQILKDVEGEVNKEIAIVPAERSEEK